MNRIPFLIRRRPLLLATSGGISGFVANAAYIEWHSNLDCNLSLPRNYDADCIDEYWKSKPITVTRRLTTVLYELCPIIWTYYRDFKLIPLVDRSNHENANIPFTHEEVQLQQKHATALREALTRLGPLFIKLGQQLSIRPDLVPPASLKELQRLCDSVEPVSDEIAFKTMREDLGDDVLNRFSNLRLVASASLVRMDNFILILCHDLCEL